MKLSAARGPPTMPGLPASNADSRPLSGEKSLIEAESDSATRLPSLRSWHQGGKVQGLAQELEGGPAEKLTGRPATSLQSSKADGIAIVCCTVSCLARVTCLLKARKG